MEVIAKFEGPYRFLSNFHPAAVIYGDIRYPTAEHAYQAAKTKVLRIRRHIAALPTPGEAKTYGRTVEILPAAWERKKVQVMLEIVRDKFRRNEDLSKKLLLTRDATLIEGNWWGDTFWGVYKGEGQNQLGKILMQVREELRRNNHVQWDPRFLQLSGAIWGRYSWTEQDHPSNIEERGSTAVREKVLGPGRSKHGGNGRGKKKG